MNSAKRIVASVRIAGAQNDLQDALANIAFLGDLSENLDEVLGTFAAHYRMASMNPIVSSQMAALDKARKGLKLAQETQKNIEGVLGLYPEDKTATRALADAKTLVLRFGKHVSDAETMIQTISKKEMPPSLKKVAKAAQALVAARMIDPSQLTLIPGAFSRQRQRLQRRPHSAGEHHQYWGPPVHRGGTSHAQALCGRLPQEPAGLGRAEG